MEIQNIIVSKALRFMNVGADPPRPKLPWCGRRQWDACIEYSFVSAGQHPKYSDPLLNVEKGDIIAAYITGCGCVGIGEVIKPYTSIIDFDFKGKTFKDLGIEKDIINNLVITNETVKNLKYLRKTLFQNCLNQNSEFLVKVKWIKTFPQIEAKWKRKFGLFANPSIQCRLENQPKTLDFLEEMFEIKFVTK